MTISCQAHPTAIIQLNIQPFERVTTSTYMGITMVNQLNPDIELKRQ